MLRAQPRPIETKAANISTRMNEMLLGKQWEQAELGRWGGWRGAGACQAGSASCPLNGKGREPLLAEEGNPIPARPQRFFFFFFFPLKFLPPPGPEKSRSHSIAAGGTARPLHFAQAPQWT